MAYFPKAAAAAAPELDKCITASGVAAAMAKSVYEDPSIPKAEKDRILGLATDLAAVSYLTAGTIRPGALTGESSYLDCLNAVASIIEHEGNDAIRPVASACLDDLKDVIWKYSY